MSHSILVVDDEPSIRNMLQDLLELQGYPTKQASSGEEALEVVRKWDVELVLADLKMTGMDGLELAQKLLEQDADRPVLLMTAFGQLENAQEAVHIGVYEYFTKPLDTTNLLAGVGRALERRRLVLENRAYQRDLEHQVSLDTRGLQRQGQELEARDMLLKHLLSSRDPEETLNLAVALALPLCNCEAGALYMPDNIGEMRLEAAVGYVETDLLEQGTGLREMAAAEETRRLLQEVRQEGACVVVRTPGIVRTRFGIHSFGMVPVCQDTEVCAILE